MINLQDKKILVTGGAGFLGSYVVQQLLSQGVPKDNISVHRSKDCNLKKWEYCQTAVKGQDIVIHIAAKVGGIGLNREKPGEMFYDNIIMNVQIMEAARQAEVKKFVAIGTICSYPKFPPTPFKEDNIWNGYPEETNAPYGLAKKMLIVQSQAYKEQYGFNSINLLQTNLYGPRDYFSPQRSHVIPALIKKIYDAKIKGKKYIDTWGTGIPTRTFLYVKDAAEGIILATEKYENHHPVNLGSEQEISIKNLAELICSLMNYQGEIRWDNTKPDGQPKRILDITRAEAEFGFKSKTNLEEGLKKTIQWYLSNKEKST